MEIRDAPNHGNVARGRVGRRRVRRARERRSVDLQRPPLLGHARAGAVSLLDKLMVDAHTREGVERLVAPKAPTVVQLPSEARLLG